MKKLTFSLTLFLFINLLHAQNPLVKQWDFRFGGDTAESLTTFHQTADGGFILGGYSESGISGNKSEPNWDTMCFNGYCTNDYWIVKTDSIGNVKWDKDIGGFDGDALLSVQQTSDLGYILGGYSNSHIGGDKTQDVWGVIDYWIVKTDSTGTKQWDKDFGGTDIEDDLQTIKQTKDGGYLMSGTSYSNISGNKTEDNLAPEQTWIIKTDSLGNIKWDKTLHTNTNQHDEVGFAIEANDGCFAIANSTVGGIGGDKTQPNWDTGIPVTEDFWMIKYCDSTLIAKSNDEVININKFSIGPNPFSNAVSINILSPNVNQVSITIRDILGRTVFSAPPNNFIEGNSKTIDLSFLTKGIYVLDLRFNNEQVLKKLVKN